MCTGRQHRSHWPLGPRPPWQPRGPASPLDRFEQGRGRARVRYRASATMISGAVILARAWFVEQSTRSGMYTPQRPKNGGAATQWSPETKMTAMARRRCGTAIQTETVARLRSTGKRGKRSEEARAHPGDARVLGDDGDGRKRRESTMRSGRCRGGNPSMPGDVVLPSKRESTET